MVLVVLVAERTGFYDHGGLLLTVVTFGPSPQTQKNFWAELLQASRLIFTQVFLKMGFKFSYIYTQYSRFNKFSDNDDLPIREYV